MRYIGCKTLLLDNIKQVIDENVNNAQTFCDIFSGTATVARYFKKWYEIISNDNLYFSYVLQKGTIMNDVVPKFDALKKIGIENPIEYLNNLESSCASKKMFFYNNFAPNGNRMYLTNENALKFDTIRLKLEDWKMNYLLNEDEYYYLLACSIEGIPFVSNISGTYGAFHKTWDKRAFKNYELFKLDVTTNNKKNICYNEDANQLIRRIKGDILYIDPPYNERQYSSNYHLLETAAKYDYPELKGITGVRKDKDCKSKYCMSKEVLNVFNDLIENAKFKHIILSYNSEGLMSKESIEESMKRVGIADTFKVYEIPYRRFKSRATNYAGDTKEFLFYIRKES